MRKYQTWLIGTDGTGNRLFLADARDPDFMPDGSVLVSFINWTKSEYGGYVDNGTSKIVGIDGKVLRDLGFKGWSMRSVTKDGKQIAMVVGGELKKMNLDTLAPIILVDDVLERDLWAPDWSPDGQRIAFRMCLGGTCGVAVVSSSGGPPNILTTDDAKDPSWSPDGRSIVYWNNDGLWIFDTAPTNRRKLLSSKGNVGLPRWSADGKIYYLSPAGGSGWGIYSIDPSGSPERLVVNVPVACRWSEQRFAISR